VSVLVSEAIVPAIAADQEEAVNDPNLTISYTVERFPDETISVPGRRVARHILDGAA
jgi:hypothetical protein